MFLENLSLIGEFLVAAWQFYKQSDSKSSRKLFRFSLIHLPALMILLLLNKKYWFLGKDKDSALAPKSDQPALPSDAILEIQDSPLEESCLFEEETIASS